MRILIFSWRDIKHPKAGGAEQVMNEHAKGWVKAGHGVTHFSAKMDGLLSSETIDGIKFVRAGHQYLGVIIAGFFYYLRNRNRIDLIVDEFHGVPFFTPIYSRKPKIIVIQEVARKVWFLNPLPWPLNWIIGFVGYLGEPFVFLFYKNTQFMTGSESAKKDISKFGIQPKNITVVPHGVITPRLQAFGSEAQARRVTGNRLQLRNKKTITYLGVLSRDKGIEDAIKCFKILNQSGEYNFWVIGKPETESYRRKIKQMVSDLKLEDKIKFFGFVSQQQKFKLLSKAHLLVNPSVREGWGLVNIEANSVGIPVVAYRSPGLIDSVKDGVSGIICSENSPENLAKNVWMILGKGDLYEKLSRGAVSWSKNFNWKKSRKLSLNLINSLNK